jgi:hypothetical protein
MFTMRPASDARRKGRVARIARTYALRLIANVRFQASSNDSSSKPSGVGRDIPALLMRASTTPVTDPNPAITERRVRSSVTSTT